MRPLALRLFRIALSCLLLALQGAAAFGGGDPFGPRGIRYGFWAGLIPELSRADAQAAMEIWIREYFRISGYRIPYKLTVFDDLEAFTAAIRNGEIDFIALGSLKYLKIREEVEMEPALIGERNGKRGEEMILLVRKDSGIRGLEQLRGRKMMMMEGESGEISSLWLDALLADRRLPPGARHLGAIKLAAKAHQAILSVFFRQGDSCIVGKHALGMAMEMNPQVGAELETLATSPPYPIAVTCFRTTLLPRQKEEFVRVVLEMQSTSAGKQILTLFKLDNIVPGYDRGLDSLASLVAENAAKNAAARRPAK